MYWIAIIPFVILYGVIALMWLLITGAVFLFTEANHGWRSTDDYGEPLNERRNHARLVLLFAVWPIPLVYYIFKSFRKLVRVAVGRDT